MRAGLVTRMCGTPFGVEDVGFIFQYMKDAPTGCWTHHVSDIPTISSTTAVDADTVRFTCAFACPELGVIGWWCCAPAGSSSMVLPRSCCPDPLHPYTAALLAAARRLHVRRNS